MKQTILWAAAAVGIIGTGVMLLRGQAPAREDRVTAQRTIIADGSATVTGKVDCARVYLSVATFGKTVDGARGENARIVAKVREAILALNIDAPKSRTTDTSLRIQNPDRDREAGFNVHHSFTILVKDADPEKLAVSAGRILDAGLKNGVNGGGHIHFFKENDAELQREAMSKAVEDAVANARAHAAGANVKILEVTEIDGSQGRSYFWGGAMMQGGMGGPPAKGDATSPLPGQWAVTRQVRVVSRY